MNANTVKVGQRVTYSGFPGTIVAICEWSRSANEVLIEVRLPGGVACVTCLECIPA